jgi:uncharacterized protein (TIGR01777 family)
MNESSATLSNRESVLITGGSGLIGRYLTSLLLGEGYKVSHLSRSTSQFGKVRVYRWDPDRKYIDPEVIRGTDYIIHLSGANLGEGRWTGSRKEEIVNSRIGTANLLHSVVKSNGIPLKGFISASAVGYYGASTTENIYSETDPPGSDFLGQTCSNWEDAADLFSELNIRTVKIRTAVVLEKSDAALARFLSAARFGIFPTLGNGRQYMPWIHISDLCRVYLMAIKDEKMSGAYNAAAPDHSDNRKFVRTLSEVMNRPFISPPVPGLFLRMLMGESAVIALEGSRVSSQKLISQGFIFEFPDLDTALADILKY